MKRSADIRPFKGIKPTIAESAYIDPAATVIGDVIVGEESSIWPGVVVRGDVNHIRIGDRTNVQDGSILHVTCKRPERPEGYPLVLGNDITIGHQVILHGCTLEDGCLIGMGATVLDGAVVQEKAMVGAGSLVTEGTVVESGFLYFGSPARKRRPLTDDELSGLAKTAQSYIHHAGDHKAELI